MWTARTLDRLDTANSFSVFFYSDNGGFPGNGALREFTNIVQWTQHDSTFTINLTPFAAGQPFIPASIGSRSKPT